MCCIKVLTGPKQDNEPIICSGAVTILQGYNNRSVKSNGSLFEYALKVIFIFRKRSCWEPRLVSGLGCLGVCVCSSWETSGLYSKTLHFCSALLRLRKLTRILFAVAPHTFSAASGLGMCWKLGLSESSWKEKKKVGGSSCAGTCLNNVKNT